MSTIHERIREGRHRAGLTQTSLAEAVGVSLRQVQKWEAGKDKPSFDRLPKLASALQRDVIWLIGENRPIDEVRAEIGDSAVGQLAGIDLEEIRRNSAELNELLARHSAPRMPERNPKRVNRRDELATYRVQKENGGNPIPKWLSLACGNGCDLERSPDFIYLDLPGNSKGLHSAAIRGDSMADTLLPGDIVILEEFAGGPIILPPLGDDPKNSYRQMASRVPDQAICVISINDDAPTMKRIVYDLNRGAADWTLLILAENMLEWTPRPIGRNETVTFWAKLIGIADRPTVKTHSNQAETKTEAAGEKSKPRRSRSIPRHL